MSVDLTQNFFEVFNLPVQFEVDPDVLAARFRELQSQNHPDKFVNGTDEERRRAVQTTGFLNEGYDVLTNTRLRGRYLLTLKGVEFREDLDKTNDYSYLMEQMEIREAIEEAEHAEDPFEELENLNKIIKSRRRDVENDFQSSYDQGDFDNAKQAVLKLRFCERISGEIKRIEERLDDF